MLYLKLGTYIYPINILKKEELLENLDEITSYHGHIYQEKETRHHYFETELLSHRLKDADVTRIRYCNLRMKWIPFTENDYTNINREIHEKKESERYEIAEERNLFNIIDTKAKAEEEFLSFRKNPKTEHIIYAKVLSIVNLINEIEDLKS